jgi:hypothetical protein
MLIYDHILINAWASACAKSRAKQCCKALESRHTAHRANKLGDANLTPRLGNTHGRETTPTHGLIPVCDSKATQDAERECRPGPPREPGPVLRENKPLLAQRTLRDCDQTDEQIEEAYTAENACASGAIVTANGSNIGSLLANILSAAEFIESLDVSAWVPGEIPGVGGTQLTNVTFRGCEGRGLTLMQNVSS